MRRLLTARRSVPPMVGPRRPATYYVGTARRDRPAYRSRRARSQPLLHTTLSNIAKSPFSRLHCYLIWICCIIREIIAGPKKHKLPRYIDSIFIFDFTFQHHALRNCLKSKMLQDGHSRRRLVYCPFLIRISKSVFKNRGNDAR